MTDRDELERDLGRFLTAKAEPLGITEVEGYGVLDTPTPLTFRMAGKEILRIKPVSTLEDIENLRLIRNECREYMTYVTAEISQAQQLAWWQEVAGNPKWRVWLAYVPGWEEPVGFALLRRAAIRWFVTLGLRQWVRGQGYGTLMYEALREQADVREVWAVIREDNAASIRAAEKAGYVRGDWSQPGVIGMVGRRTGR